MSVSDLDLTDSERPCGICGSDRLEHVMHSGPTENWYGWLCRDCGAHRDLHSGSSVPKVWVPSRTKIDA